MKNVIISISIVLVCLLVFFGWSVVSLESIFKSEPPVMATGFTVEESNLIFSKYKLMIPEESIVVSLEYFPSPQDSYSIMFFKIKSSSNEEFIKENKLNNVKNVNEVKSIVIEGKTFTLDYVLENSDRYPIVDQYYDGDYIYCKTRSTIADVYDIIKEKNKENN